MPDFGPCKTNSVVGAPKWGADFHRFESDPEDRLADEITDPEVSQMSRITKRLSGAGALAILALAAVLAGCGGGDSTPIALKSASANKATECRTRCRNRSKAAWWA